MISFGPDICTNFDKATSREWLETNGIGGFASGTISGTQTRRYHGLLTAATEPPLGRRTLLSKFEETLRVGDEEFELSSNQYPGVVHPRGYIYMTGFRLDPFPMWTYDAGGVIVERKVFMVHGENTVVCRWAVAAGSVEKRIELELRPLLSFTDYHSIQHQDPELDPHFDVADGVVTIHPYRTMPELFFSHSSGEVTESGEWYRNFEYAIEKERGFDYREDLFQPFVLKFDLSRGVDLIVSDVAGITATAAERERREVERREALASAAEAASGVEKQLVLAADQFVVKRGAGHTIIAGYPWFSDWGRDTMIALNGITLATNRPEIALGILLEYSRHISQGMLPNRFPDAGGEAEYNTVDATLWYFEAVRAYLEKTGDHTSVRSEIYPKLSEIITWHLRGTRFNIHVDTDGLLYAGEPGVQLTWMDAKIGELVVTPRTGKPVEVQALWYNALKIVAELAEQYGDDPSQFNDMAELAKLSFNAVFWNKDELSLFDVVENGDRDGSIRPNQILAVSLPHSMLAPDRAQLVVNKVETELLTPVGLRSLSPGDPAYVPRYSGSPFERDSAYHQGTVWGWLIGPFIDAYAKAYPERVEIVESLIAGLRKHLLDAGVGQVSEIFDAEPPFAPRGCPAQAWSVGELLRIVQRYGG